MLVETDRILARPSWQAETQDQETRRARESAMALSTMTRATRGRIGKTKTKEEKKREKKKNPPPPAQQRGKRDMPWCVEPDARTGPEEVSAISQCALLDGRYLLLGIAPLAERTDLSSAIKLIRFNADLSSTGMQAQF